MAHAQSTPARGHFALTSGVVLVCFLVFAGIVAFAYLNTRDTSLTPDLAKVDEADRWKFTVTGREGRLRELRGKELTAATTYGWVDQSAGVVRLPLDRAMELIVEEQNRKAAR